MERSGADRGRDPHEARPTDEHATHPGLHRIVVAIDFMPPSIDALHWVAQTLAPAAELILVHALERGGLWSGDPRPPAAPERHDAEAAAARLQAIADTLHHGPTVRVEVREDRPPAAIAFIAETTGADMIVVGPHGGTEAIRGIGSTAERLVRVSPVPVLVVVHPRARPTQRVLVAVDQAQLTPEVMRWADLFVHDARAAVTLAHVFDPRIAAPGEWRQESIRPDAADPHPWPSFGDFVGATEGWLVELARELTGSARVELSVTVGEPGQEIIALAERTDTNLIIIGRAGRSRRVPAVLGSTASNVLRRAPCPVLVVVEQADAAFEPWRAGE